LRDQNLNERRLGHDESLRRGGVNWHTGSRSATPRHGRVGEKTRKEAVGSQGFCRREVEGGLLYARNNLDATTFGAAN